MNPEPPKGADTPAGSSARRSVLRISVVLGALLLVVSGMIVIFGVKPDQQVAWLSPAELDRTTRPGPLTRMRYQITRAMGPLWQFFRGRRTQITVSSKLIALPPQAPGNAGLPAAQATNSDGTRVWVLSVAELAKFKQQLSATGVSSLNEARVTTLDGRRAQIFSGGSPPAGTNTGIPSCGLDLTPKLIRDSFRLTLGVTATEFVLSANPPVYDLRTNICAALRVMVENSGAVLVISGKTNANGHFYGIIVSPVAVDPAGNPIKL